MTDRANQSRRAPGTGQLWARPDTAGRETWYGKWTTDGVRIKRVLGRKRSEHRKDGLTRQRAEARLRELMADANCRRSMRHCVTTASISTART